jgi:phosphoglycerate dehydrogenase-like enzyme
VKLIIKQVDNDGRLSLVPRFLTTQWDIEVADTEDKQAFDLALKSADAIISMDWKWDVPTGSRLRLVQLPGAGVDAIDFSKLGPVSVCNCYEHEIGIAEYVLGAMLEWTIGVRTLDRTFRRNDWTGSYLCGPRHGELFGKTIGILGYGRIGREVARRAVAFGMRVVACTRTPRPDPNVERMQALDGFDALLSESDFVLLTVPLEAQTTGIMNERAFRLMRPHAVLINVARGALIDEAALYAALSKGTIAGAIIDVWYRYPPQGETQGPPPASLPFHELDNILMTPHASAWTDGLLPRRNRAVAENLNRLARGEPLVNVVKAAHRT